MARILIGGDICPTDYDVKLFLDGDAKSLFGDILNEFSAADLVVANLETPLLSKPSPVVKSGSIFGWPEGCLNAIKISGINLLNLGNNHIFDHGAAGVESTLQACRDAGIDSLGAGLNLKEAQKPYVFVSGGQRIAFFSFAEHEFSIATPNSSGASPLDPIDFVKVFREYRAQFDFAVVLLHGGKEHYPFPTPGLQKICRFMIDEGVNAVLCQHSHCPGGYERHKKGVIFYGQGNFIFNPFPDKRPWLYEGFLVAFDFEKNHQCRWEIIPFMQQGQSAGIKALTGKEKSAFLARIEDMSSHLQSPGFVESKWREYSADKESLYLGILRGYGPFMRRLDAKLNISKALYSRKDLLVLLNVIRCETHRELLLEILSSRLSR